MQNNAPEPLSESLFPMYGDTFWWNLAALEILGLAGAAPFILTITEFSPFPTIAGFFIAALILTPVFFFCVFFTARNRHRKGGSITSNGELVSVYHHFDGNHCFCSEKLSECRWFRGSRSWATVPWSVDPFGPWFSGRSLMIEFPARCRTEPRYKTDKKGKRNLQYPPGPVIVAVGRTPEMEAQWESLLFRLGIPHDEQRESQPAPVTDECALVAILVTFAVCLAVSYGFTKLLYDALLRWQVPVNVADGVYICMIVSGTVLPSFAMMASVYLRRREQDVKASGLFLTTVREVVGWFFGSAMLMVFVFWLSPGMSEQTKTIASIVMCPIAFITVFIFCQIDKAGKSDEKSVDGSLHAPAEDTKVDDFTRYSGHFDHGAYGP